jgi:hypothetical protein
MTTNDGLPTDLPYRLRPLGALRVPVFLFRVPSVPDAAHLLEHQYVETDVRHTRDGRLAYHLDIPDRRIPPLAVPVRPEHVEAVARAAATFDWCVPQLVDDAGATLDLGSFTKDVVHDWTGTYARAHEHFMADRYREALATLAPLLRDGTRVPAVHHVAGRCHRHLDELEIACAHYERGLHHCVATVTRAFLPRASSILSDLAVALKRCGRDRPAVWRLLHSLALRPNHPEAIGTFVTLVPRPDLVVHGLARLIALGHASFVDPVVANVSRTTGIDARAYLERAREVAPRLDLGTSPLVRAGLGEADVYSAHADAPDIEAWLPPRLVEQAAEGPPVASSSPVASRSPDLAARVRKQLEDGSVWNDRDTSDPHDGLITAMRAPGADRASFSAAIFPLLASADVRHRTGAVALLREIVPEVGADAAAAAIRDHEPLYRDVEAAWRIEREELEPAAALAVGSRTSHGDRVAIAWLEALALGRSWGWLVLLDLARLDPEWVITHARGLVPHDHIGVLLTLTPDQRLRLAGALQPYPPEASLRSAKLLWTRLPPDEAARLRARMWPSG